jgi:hypothetical protein
MFSLSFSSVLREGRKMASLFSAAELVMFDPD